MMSLYLELMTVFAKVACGAFGGGLAAIPFIYHELVTLRPWLTEEMFSQTIALAQMTPGPVALNSATFVGFRLGSAAGGAFGGAVSGFFGSLLATISLVCTPLLIIACLLLLISAASEKMQARIAAFQKALRPVVAGLLLAAFWSLAKPLLPDFSSFEAAVPGLCLSASALVCFGLSRIKLFKTYPQLIILFSAVLGLCLHAAGAI